MTPYYADESVTLYHGDCLDVLSSLPDASVDSVVTDPPYGLEFMGKEWDSFKPTTKGIEPCATPTTEPVPRTIETGAHGASAASSTTASAAPSVGVSGGRQTDPARAASATIVQPDAIGGFQDGNGGNAYSRSRVRTNTQRHGGDAKTANQGFQQWCEAWATECLRVLKPGGHLLAFGGTRTWHRLACAVEDAGFEVRDSIAWLYGSGFPKSLDVSKAIDKAARGVPQGGVDPTSPNHGKYRTTTTEGKRWDGDSGQGYGAGGSRFLTDGVASGSATEPVASGDAATAAEAIPWQGWGTALKPAFEPVVVARKPLVGTVAANVLAHGTGALNIDGCRIGDEERTNRGMTSLGVMHDDDWQPRDVSATVSGRWPANVVLDDTQAAVLDEQSGESSSRRSAGRQTAKQGTEAYGDFTGTDNEAGHNDQCGASRFFPTFRYEAKAPASERPKVNGTAHPTVKPLELMRWLVRLVTPPSGTVLEPFAGSGTTVEACILEGFHCIAIEREVDYLPLIESRIARRRNPVKAIALAGEDLGLFGEASA